MPANQTDSAPGLVEALEFAIAYIDGGIICEQHEKEFRPHINVLEAALSAAKEAKPAASVTADMIAEAAELSSRPTVTWTRAEYIAAHVLLRKISAMQSAPPTLTPASVAEAISSEIRAYGFGGEPSDSFYAIRSVAEAIAALLPESERNLFLASCGVSQ